MKKIATNTLASLVLIGIISLSSVQVAALARTGAPTGDRQLLRRLERAYSRHDRKHELRASVLGVSPEQLREQLRSTSLDAIVKKHGFKDRLGFYIAMTGKLKGELKKRGWSERKLEEFVQKRLARLTDSSPKYFAPAV